MDLQLLIKTAMSAGELMLCSGAETYRVEDTMYHILKTADNLEMSEVLVVMTGITASVKVKGEKVVTLVKRVESRENNLSRVVSVNDISRRYCGGELSLQAAYEELNSLKKKEYRRLSYSIATVAVCVGFSLFFGEIVHDRIMLEVFRGCSRGCRFCHAGMVYRPVRERKPEVLQDLARKLVDNTGYNEISLVSLSSADYSCLAPMVHSMIEEFKDDRVSVSLPSLRIDSFCVAIAKEIQAVRKSGLTFAPEAGSQKMRDVINKGVTEEDLMNAVGAAFESGWNSVK